MADWWEQDSQAGGTATASKWWESDPEPGMRTETLPNDQPFQMAEGTSFDELMQTAIAGQPAARQANIDRMVGTLPEDATRLEELNFKRRQELITGEPANPTGDKRLDDITRQRLAKEIADMNAKGLSPDEMLLEERYQAEQDPLNNLINAPIMRGAMTGVQNAASSIAETALRILPGEGAPSQLADKIGRQRAAEAQYQAYLDQKQGAAAALPNTVTQMTGEYLPLSASGVPAALQVGVKGANDAYLKSDSDTYAFTSAITGAALTYAGGKLAGGTWIDMLGGKVAGKKLAPLMKGFGFDSAEEIGQLYGQAMIDRGFGVGDGSMPTAKDAVWTLATVLGARGVGTAMSAGIEDDGVNKPSVESRAYDAMKKFAERKWPSRKLAKEAGVDQVATTAKQRAELATDIRNRLTGQQFEEQLRTAAVSPEQADLDMETWKAKATAAGETFDEYVGRRVGRIERTTREEVAAATGRTIRQDRRGEIDFEAMKDEGLAVIRLFEGANESTFIHESAHLFRRDLQGQDAKTSDRWAGARNGKWGRRAEEKFARGFERYLREGVAPNKELETIFSRYKAALTKVYGAIKGTAIDVNISPEMRGVFDRLLTPAETNTQAQGATNGQVQTQGRTKGQVARIPHPLDDNSPLELGTFPPPESDILSQDLADRFRGLANQTTLPEARAANYEADVAMGMPERKAWADAEQKALGRLQSDFTGELAGVMQRIDQANATGGVINMPNQEETALVNRLGDIVSKDLSTPEARALHRKIRFAFRQARSDQARALGYRDPMAVMDPQERKAKSITDAIAEPTPEETEARKKARTPEEHAEVDRRMEERYTAAKEALAKQGIDLDDIQSIVSDPKKSMVVLDHMRASGKISDVLYEYWRNSILSGPTTQATNIIGNTVFGAWNLGVERTVEAAVNIFGRNKKAATFGEFRHLIGGVLPGIVRGIRNARTSWSLETSALAEELGRDGAFKVDGPRGSIKGRMGRLVRAMGYRPLLAADEFAKSVVVTMEVGARAYRHGKELGLEGNELQTFIQQQTDDLGSVAWSEAFAKAEELTFQGNRGMVAQNLAKGGNRLRSIPGARWVLPFVDTPSAIFEQGIKRMPVLGAILDYAESRRSGMNLVDAGLTPTLARQIIAFGGLALLWEAVSGDDPWLTGADPLSDPKNRDVAFRAQPPMSVKIGDKWYSYARIEPFATAIATTADSVKGIQNGKYYKPMTGLIQQAKEKSYLDGLGDAIDAIQGAVKGETAPTEQYFSKFGASWVPNLYRQTVRSAEGEMPENRMWGKSDDRFKRFLNRTGQQAGLPFVESQPRFDLWGQPISYNDMGDSPATSFAFRLMSPVKAKDLSTVQQADMALIRWNEKHPDDQEVYSEPQKYIKIQDQTQYLTDEQHAQYAQLSGQLAQQFVSGISFDPVNPTSQQIARIKGAIAKAREAARKQLIPTWTFD